MLHGPNFACSLPHQFSMSNIMPSVFQAAYNEDQIAGKYFCITVIVCECWFVLSTHLCSLVHASEVSVGTFDLHTVFRNSVKLLAHKERFAEGLDLVLD